MVIPDIFKQSASPLGVYDSYSLRVALTWYNKGMKGVRKNALINAFATFVYVAAIGTFLYYAGLIKLGQSKAIFIPITFLLLFVFSAAITSYLIFGKPAQLYIDGKKKEALSLLTQTLIFLSIFTLLTITLSFIATFLF